MKIKRYEDIQPSNRTNFRMLYYHAGRALNNLETILKKVYGNQLPLLPKQKLIRLQHKLEQMAARYKQCENELKKECQIKMGN